MDSFLLLQLHFTICEKIIDGKAPVYHHEGEGDTDFDSEEKESFGRKVYKHLMNGVSHMLPFVVGGGVLIALGFLLILSQVMPMSAVPSVLQTLLPQSFFG